MNILGEGYTWVAIVVGLGVPVLLVVLTEVLGALDRRGSAAAGPVRFLRNWVVPVGMLFAFLAVAVATPSEHTAVRVTATLLGFLVILLVLNAFNVALFTNAEQSSWRARIPSIFVDIARIALIIVGLSVLFSWVWGANVSGLFAALGVTSIVIGLALQNAVGSVISGLLLLFEQPFKIGDWLDTGSVQGRVLEVNWRAVHIETPGGVQVVPNAALAGSSFTNMSRHVGDHQVTVNSTFSTDDPPHEVMRLLLEVGEGVKSPDLDGEVTSSYLGSSSYVVGIPVHGPALADDARSRYLARLWYAARRRGLALDGDDSDPLSEPGRLRKALEEIGGMYGLGDDDLASLAEVCWLERYGVGELLTRPGAVPDEMQFVVEGRLQVWTPVKGGRLDVVTVESGDYIGHTTLTREASPVGATAVVVTTVLAVPRAILDSLVLRRPVLARNIGQSQQRRDELSRAALSAAGLGSRR